MIRDLIFYNKCNFGDIHVSRELVKYTMDVACKQNPDCNFFYYHGNSPRLTVDIPGLVYRPIENMPWPPMNHASEAKLRSFQYKDAVYFNTWYAASPIFDGMFCTLNTLHELFKKNLKDWFQHDITPHLDRFLPTYDASLLEAQGVDHLVAGWFSDPQPGMAWKSRVLVCNNVPMSGQTKMPPGVFEAAMQPLIDKYKDALFIVTNPDVHQFSGDNVIFARDITDVDGCDLPEIGYLSSFCDVIIGRGSGPYSFALTKDNLTEPTTTFVCFTDDERVARWVYMSDVVRAKIVWSNDYALENVSMVIDSVLAEHIKWLRGE